MRGHMATIFDVCYMRYILLIFTNICQLVHANCIIIHNAPYAIHGRHLANVDENM